MGEFIKTMGKTAEEIHEQGVKLAEEEKWEEAHKMFLKAASMGYARAYCAVGMDFFYGEGVEADYKKAYYYFDEAYKRGWEKAAIYLGYMYYFAENFDLEDDDQKAFFYLCIGANLGDAVSMSLLSKCYYYEYGCEGEANMQLYWAEKAIDAGDKLAYETLGYYFIQKCLVEDGLDGEYEKNLAYARFCLEEYANYGGIDWESLLCEEDAESEEEKNIYEKIRKISAVKPPYLYSEEKKKKERDEMKSTGMSAGQANEFYYERFQYWNEGN